LRIDKCLKKNIEVDAMGAYAEVRHPGITDAALPTALHFQPKRKSDRAHTSPCIVSSIDQEAGMSKIVTQAISIASVVALAQGVAFAAGQETTTTTIKRDSDNAKSLAEPSYQTREERLRAKPLDWNTTIGKPKRKTQTAAEKKALAEAKPESMEGGAPDPKAQDEARRLHPDEWKQIDQK
jgi:hypothetical protein